jgi:Asp-tRNA(Asn)/Glu-tRNA(Gln) amidotransferase A subunit family amidase
MPVGLQLIARRLEEEKVLAMTATVIEAIRRP